MDDPRGWSVVERLHPERPGGGLDRVVGGDAVLDRAAVVPYAA
jgi:hypothetical protein